MSDREKLRISTRVMFDALRRHGVPVRIIDASLSMLEYEDTAGYAHFLFSTASDKSSAVGHVFGNNKIRTEIIATELGIPTPDDIVCDSFEDALHFLTTYKRVVLKPLDNSGGLGVTTNIQDTATLREAYTYGLKYGAKIIAQQHITGTDVRLLVVAGTFRSAVERRPASVIGDGTSTINALIEMENASGKRAHDSMLNLSLINTDSARKYLKNTAERIPEIDEVVPVVGPANLSLGGTAHEATHLVTERMIADAEKISRKLRVGLCGVDIMWDQSTNSYALIEVNATPGINMHNDPFWKTKSDAVDHYVEWLINPATGIPEVP